MRVVVDANVVVAALIRPDGWAASDLRREDVEWIAPSFLLDELRDHEEEYAEKAGCSTAEWRGRLRAVARRMTLSEASDVLSAWDSPLVRRAERVDPDDAVHIATLVATGADLLWTRDNAILEAFPGVAVSVLPR